MDRRKLRYRLEFLAHDAKAIAKNNIQGSRAFARDEQPRLARARVDILNALPATAKLDRIIECAEIIEQRRFESWQALRKADKIRLDAEADLKEAEIETLIVEISGHLGSQ